MKTAIKLLAAFALLAAPLSAHADGKTCGQMLADKAVLPAKMAEVMTAVTNMMEAHAKFMMTNKDKDSKKEAAALQKVAKEHKALAAAFKKTSESMKKLADLPGAPHDVSKLMADPAIMASMKAMLTTHKEMIALMQKEVTEMESMAPKGAGAGAPAK